MDKFLLLYQRARVRVESIDDIDDFEFEADDLLQVSDKFLTLFFQFCDFIYFAVELSYL